MDRLVNAVVRGSSAAVVPLLLRSSIAWRWPVYQQSLDTLAYTGYLHPPVVSRNHGTTNVQTAGNPVADQSKRLLIIKQVYLSMKWRECNRTKWPKPTSNSFERNFWKGVNLIDQMLRGLHGGVYLLDIDINNKNHDTKEDHEERIRSFESTIRVGCLRDKGADHLGDPLWVTLAVEERL